MEPDIKEVLERHAIEVESSLDWWNKHDINSRTRVASMAQTMTRSPDALVQTIGLFALLGLRSTWLRSKGVNPDTNGGA